MKLNRLGLVLAVCHSVGLIIFLWLDYIVMKTSGWAGTWFIILGIVDIIPTLVLIPIYALHLLGHLGSNYFFIGLFYFIFGNLQFYIIGSLISKAFQSSTDTSKKQPTGSFKPGSGKKFLIGVVSIVLFLIGTGVFLNNRHQNKLNKAISNGAYIDIRTFSAIPEKPIIPPGSSFVILDNLNPEDRAYEQEIGDKIEKLMVLHGYAVSTLDKADYVMNITYSAESGTNLWESTWYYLPQSEYARGSFSHKLDKKPRPYLVEFSAGVISRVTYEKLQGAEPSVLRNQSTWIGQGTSKMVATNYKQALDYLLVGVISKIGRYDLNYQNGFKIYENHNDMIALKSVPPRSRDNIDIPTFAKSGRNERVFKDEFKNVFKASLDSLTAQGANILTSDLKKGIIVSKSHINNGPLAIKQEMLSKYIVEISHMSLSNVTTERGECQISLHISDIGEWGIKVAAHAYINLGIKDNPNLFVSVESTGYMEKIILDLIEEKVKA